MDIKQFNDQLRKLEKDAGKHSADALLQIMEFKMEDFKTYLDHKFEINVKWILGIGFTVITIMMGLMMGLIKFL